MSFNSKDFSVMAYANGFTLWNYNTADTLADVKGTGYFNETAPFARTGDMVLAIAGKGGTIAPAILVIASIADGVVAVSDLTSAAA